VNETQLGKVCVKECPTFDEAQAQAGIEATNTSGMSLPVVIFYQGNRMNLSGALYFGFVANRLMTRSAPKKGSIRDATDSMNRPEVPEHSVNIAKYIKENKERRYILPPLTLNIQDDTNLYTAKASGAKVKSGFLVINPTSKLAITDGQHRRSAIIEVLNEMPELATDAIGVMITCETESSQIHQDFADCSKTKPLPPSQLAVYDLRNPANRIVLEAAEQCQIFRGRVDATSKTLGKHSTQLFLANHIRQFVKMWLTGSYQIADDEFQKRANELLSNEDDYQRIFKTFLDYVNHLTNAIPVWRKIAALSPGLESNRIKEWRNETGYVCMSVTGLLVLGKIGYELFQQPNDEVNWRQYADRLGLIDWSKGNKLWSTNLVRDNKIVSNQKLVREAIAAVRNEIGWKPKTTIEEPATDEAEADAEMVAQS
jgi:DNA sulfur modification protein DndB